MMDINILKKYNKPGPRYTSYPPATSFTSDFLVDDYKNCLIESNELGEKNISLYVHVPFCKNLCYFCGCNTNKFKDDSLVENYFKALIAEIKNISRYLDKNREVTQIHWGGGTPNSVSLSLVASVMDLFKSTFKISPKAEIAMECNPAYLEFEHIEELRAMGFNRLSLGIQDFNNQVLKTVNRAPSKHPVEDLVSKMKEEGFQGVNIDLIYGLPGQTVDSFTETIKKAVHISPDRLVTFSYAHVPWVKSAQKKLEIIGLPTTEDKLKMFGMAYKLLTENGYRSIGMDHYAKPDDELTKALENAKLHRNFQGYCTRETTGQVYSFGATSISQLEGAYIQNTKDTQAYIDNIGNSGFSVERGYKLTLEEKVIREVINEIMCNGQLDFDQVADHFRLSTSRIKEITGYKPETLKPFIEDNLLKISKAKINLKQLGFLVVRNVAMLFDPAMKENKAQFSKTI